MSLLLFVSLTGYLLASADRPRGFPEVVFGPGKTPEQILGIVERLQRAGQTVLVTRVGPEIFEAVVARHHGAVFHEAARMVTLKPRKRRARRRRGIVVLSAGTSDIPVAEEAAITAELMGNHVQRIYDVGVAGLHRLLTHRRALMSARVIVAVAGMEGALPSVVSGLTACPVIGVPTSIGYGAGSGGQAALLAMLNSCSSGVTVVNIDNEFGYCEEYIGNKSSPFEKKLCASPHCSNPKYEQTSVTHYLPALKNSETCLTRFRAQATITSKGVSGDSIVY